VGTVKKAKKAGQGQEGRARMGEWQTGGPGGQQAGSSSPSQSLGVAGDRAEAWQQALAQLGGRPGSYDPEQVAELARRAGIGDPSRLADLARSFGSGALPAALGAGQHVLFFLDETPCALPAEAVQGVERFAEVTPVPNTAAWMLGVVQVWGSIVSVVDLQAFLGLPPVASSGSRGRLMVVNGGEMSVGFLVTPLVEMQALGENLAGRLDPSAVPEWLRPYALGSVVEGDRAVVVLDPLRLLASEKLRRYYES
jgi:purine-binding chemotaxis protein CheW